MNDYARVGDGIAKVVVAVAVVLAIFVPLGTWKLIEIIAWCWRHLTVTVQ